ncbi:protein phosphatase 2C domain-containing protein [Spirosoma sp. SC4-14]|uniref:protein phosphatase 2C domain-containing protein n=1 Tax=Spirosoma sp. SC4-14 TaxID=3128900 RepID=UPI0030CC2AA8
MKLSIHQPLGYSYQGGRSNNEDTVFPVADSATQQQRWFMVCDGVGGAARGEIASHIAVEGFNNYFVQNPEPVATPNYIQTALDWVQAQFDDYLARHPEAIGMATTLTLLFLHEAGATVAHIGDSRVYHVRHGRIIWRTEDHSLVNQLVRTGIITPEEARDHPQRNVIERAIQGNSKAIKADVQLINDVRPGDYFFLCTDGVLERVSDELLENVLGGQSTNEQKKQLLIDCCAGKTNDNFSAYLVQIDTVSGDVPEAYRVPVPIYDRPKISTDETVAVVAVDSKHTKSIPENESGAAAKVEPVFRPQQQGEQKDRKRSIDVNSLSILLIIAFLASLLTMGGLSAYKWWIKPPKKTQTGKVQQGADNQTLHNGLPSTNKPKPKRKPAAELPKDPNLAATEGIYQAIEQGNDQVELTEHLYKKRTDEGWVLVDEKGHRQGASLYDEIREPSDKLIAVKQKGKWGYINLKGKTAITCQYDNAADFEDGKALVMLKEEEYYIDRKGNKLGANASAIRKNTPDKRNYSA